ncbi:MAG: efflux transporter outer membrane subunit [Ramlibacter sp.]|nr:efflux transporter outer membrane subunit [Ramlibacter sp.]
MKTSFAHGAPQRAFFSDAPRRVFQASALVLALGLTACANFSGIQSQAQLRDAASVGLASGATAPAVGAEWWREFGDPQLDALVAQALQDSPSLKLAQARLARAQAVTEVANAATRPQLGAGVDLTHQRYTENGPVPPPLAGSVRDSGTTQLSASWELDFFGKNRAALDAALGVARAAEADAQAARVLLASNVARTWFQLARLNDQLAVAQRTLDQREQTLGLVRDRVNAGLDTRLELRQAEGGLPEARQQIEALREQATLAQNALAALVGQPNQAVVQSPRPLSAIKIEANAAVIPANLLGRRADISAARWRVEAATQDVGSARAQFYPNINLTAFAGFSSIGLGRLLEAGSQQWGVGPALRLPIFDGGRLRANLRGKTADLDAAIESYNGAVVEAVHEVADQLASASSITRQQTEQRAAQEAAEGAYDIAVQRYKAGLGNYLNVLTAESGVLNQRRLAVDLAARALDTRVGLLRALGGGYQADAVVAAK